MFFKNLVTLTATAMIGLTFMFAGCDDGDLPEGKAPANDISEQTATIEPERVSVKEPEVVFASADPMTINLESAETVSLDKVHDIIYYDSTLYAAYNDGLVIYDFRTGAVEKLGPGKEFRALAFYDGKLYAGGEGLYTLEDKALVPVDGSFQGSVRALYSDGFRLLIGTDKGLFSKSPFSEDRLMDSASVATLQFDRDGLWVGTVGQGLFRWDGNDFKKRFLLRDTCIFDFVHDMAYAHGYLYLAAESGFFVFDGGKWTPWTTAEGMPSDMVWDIEPAGYKVYLATDAGVVYYYENTLYPVEKLEDISATALAISGRKIFIGSADGRILMKSGDMVSTLYGENTLVENESLPEADFTETPEDGIEVLSVTEAELTEE